jgi:hypothetical protein
MRVIPTPDGVLLAMANAGESGFHVCWAAGSRVALELFEAATAAHGAERATVEKALRMVSERFVAAANRVGNFKDDEWQAPHASFMAVGCAQASVSAAWIGLEGAILARDFRAVWATTAHDLHAELRAAGKPAPEGLPRAVARLITEGVESRWESSEVGALAGDTLVVANSYVRDRLGDDGIASRASASLGPQQLAEELVRLAYEAGDVPVATVMVARREPMERSP